MAVGRKEQRKRREKSALKAALVGYTNAGKSSLLNRLCRENILEENKLFATLDATFRMLNPDTRPPMVLIDTVGFISNLPNTLIEGFKTTLESAKEADILLIVTDFSDPRLDTHLKITTEVLSELEILDRPQLHIFTKVDLVPASAESKLKKALLSKAYPSSFFVSTFNEKDMNDLRDFITDSFLKMQEEYDLFIPYESGDAHARLKSETNVIKASPHETGIYYRVRCPEYVFQSKKACLREFLINSSEEL